MTPVIDGNTIYGADEATSRYLRSGITGQLRMNPAFADLGLKELLPMKLNVPDEGCIRSNSSQYCFESGNLVECSSGAINGCIFIFDGFRRDSSERTTRVNMYSHTDG